MAKLQCDICGGKIIVQGGGQFGECESCGANYSLDRMRELASGMKVSVTGTKDDVEQWKTLLKTYLAAFDYDSAEKTVKKILEAAPEDEYANEVYKNLQEWKHFEIKNGVLVKYHGRAEVVVIPDGVIRIELTAFSRFVCKQIKVPGSVKNIEIRQFSGISVQEIILCDGVQTIGDFAFARLNGLHTISLPDSVVEIGAGAFDSCINLQEVKLPANLKVINRWTFQHCRAMTRIDIPYGLERIERLAFYGCISLKSLHIPDTVTFIDPKSYRTERYGSDIEHDARVFDCCSSLEWIKFPAHLDNNCFIGTMWYSKLWRAEREKQQAEWKLQGKCQHCGGEFKGVFTKTCSKCGKVKDY